MVTRRLPSPKMRDTTRRYFISRQRMPIAISRRFRLARCVSQELMLGHIDAYERHYEGVVAC